MGACTGKGDSLDSSAQRKKILIFDTTLRDGEQSPGASLTHHEKLIIARQLARLRVDVIEAGFPIASDGDFKAVKAIAQNVKGPVICGLARATDTDIDRCWEAIKYAPHPRIHTFIATSSIHLENKLQKSEDEVIALVQQAVAHARSYCDDVEFSPEDSTRTGFEYLCNIVRAAIQAGATTINIPDTVGYAVPEEFGGRITRLLHCVPECEDICLSVHCHNDLGNAVANSLTAIKYGATQVECCINGIGERAGNAATEEVVMNLVTRKDYFNAEVHIDTKEIFRTSRLVSRLTRLDVQRNKAVVGENAFAHEAGIHQHGILRSKKTYEIMTPSLIGWIGKGLIIGKHSGKHAIHALLKKEGYDPTPQQLSTICGKVKELADKHKQIERDDIIAIANDVIHQLSDEDRIITLHEFIVTTGNRITSTASVRMSINGEEKIGASTGVGSVDALSNAIQTVIDPSLQLIEFNLRAITGGTDALADVSITLQDYHMNLFSAGAVDEDIVRASALAIIKGANKALIYQKKRIEREAHEGN
jgi:2-isopropylmalate synthase